jgi:hypothetical protein
MNRDQQRKKSEKDKSMVADFSFLNFSSGSHGISFMETSALDLTNVDRAFESILQGRKSLHSCGRPKSPLPLNTHVYWFFPVQN